MVRRISNLNIEFDFYQNILREINFTVLRKGSNEKRLSLDGLSPIVINKKQLIKFEPSRIYGYDNSKYITFRPFKNGKHCQILIDYMIENSNDEVKIDVFKSEDDNTFSAILIQEKTGEIMLQVDGCRTETEAKCLLFIDYYFGNKDEEYKKMVELEEDYFKRKAEKIEKLKEQEKEEKKKARKKKEEK